jgi:transcriptional regulator
VDALAIFQGPQAYITPNWYPTKQEHGKVVPTWNYAVVHAHARLRVKDDPAWVREQIEALTQQQEAGMPMPWSVGDAPADYVARLANGIVGIELEITRLAGKWKVSQNQPAQNQTGVAHGLRGKGEEAAAALVEEYSSDRNGKPA